jgi:hypothetical protein
MNLVRGMSAPKTQAKGDELLLAHLHVLTGDERDTQPPESRVSDRIGPGLAGLLMRALSRRSATRSARRL